MTIRKECMDMLTEMEMEMEVFDYPELAKIHMGLKDAITDFVVKESASLEERE